MVVSIVKYYVPEVEKGRRGYGNAVVEYGTGVVSH